MTDQTQVQDTATTDAAQDVADDQQQGTAQDATTPTGFDALPKETQDEIRKLRRENAKFRTQVKEIEDAQMTEAEKRDLALKAAEERATAAEQRYREATGRAVVSEAATKQGAISTRAVYALIRDQLEFDETTGDPVNVDALIAQAKKDEPTLFRAAAGSGDGGKGGSSPNGTDMNALIRQKAGRQ